MKIKIHFNRVNMQRGDSRVWSAHAYNACNMAERVVVRHKGKVVLETVYKPNATQPRAYLLANGKAHLEGRTAIVEI